MKPEVTIQNDDVNGWSMSLAGELSIRWHKEIQDAFRELVNAQTAEKRVQLKLPSMIDLSFIQMLASVKRFEEGRGITLIIKAELKEDHHQLIAKTGWLPLFNLSNSDRGL